MSITSISKQTIRIKKSINAPGSMGGEKRTFSTRNDANGNPLTGIAASIQNKTGRIVDDFARRGVKISHAIYTEVDVSASVIGDTVIDQAGNIYVVRYVSDMAAQMRCWQMLVELTAPASLPTSANVVSVTSTGTSSVVVAFDASVPIAYCDVTMFNVSGVGAASGIQTSDTQLTLTSPSWDASTQGLPWDTSATFFDVLTDSGGTVS